MQCMGPSTLYPGPASPWCGVNVLHVFAEHGRQRKEASFPPAGARTAVPGDRDLPFMPAAHTHGQAFSDTPGCPGPWEACGAAEEEEI